MTVLSPTPVGGLTAGVLCLRSGAEPADWFLDQVHALRAAEWEPDPDLDDETWLAALAAAVTSPVHIVAVGPAVPRALLLAARRRDLVTSVLAADPALDLTDPGYRDLLGQVRVPTLVVVAAPDEDADLGQAQSIAGGVENGVMVVIDGVGAPAHRTSPASFAEWATSFMTIAEGLPTPTIPSGEDDHA